MVDPLLYVRCQQLLAEFWSAMDNRRTDELMSLVADNIRWQREKMYEGRENVRAAIEARPGNLQIRHLISNLTIARIGAGQLEAKFLLSPVFAMAKDGASAPYPSEPVLRIAEFKVGISETAEALSINSILFEMLFEREIPGVA
ncbi:nuclear transport factor 2 family protein [Rhizorhabdus sp.]|uniref:nuclear transport factor 2 family protein n=1 Tax=Rhizorhabdus sp. TaxID=1968843 RepID=UPI0019C49631|nr:nuclear transport factor 2 family protein [Rhizorhabdus sp.]MBD3759636.1 nuclear transport factor 2 family protein [Rhizorhabdus sp.]